MPRSTFRGTRELLFVGEEERISIRNVDVVYADADSAYIRSGATPGERVILTALEAPFNVMPVRTDADAPVEADSDDESSDSDSEQVASAEEDGE